MEDGADALKSFSEISYKANLVGTLAYMSPEQLQGNKVSLRDRYLCLRTSAI